ncbi:hypothetical protein BpHYR1_011123 [Brachionus plicatilis]|uniref:Uncharacterized protein n=1 Tax=Brachionus plicatilis TaxID=10195 RepID=A0A3M7R9R2_BRAPC|nr:hypothetical protein BpHYR1_011123 [Brachionus plicatilis]
MKRNDTKYFLMLGTVQTAIDAAKNCLNREQDRLDGRSLWRPGRRPKIWTAKLAGQSIDASRNLRSKHISENNFLKKSYIF